MAYMGPKMDLFISKVEVFAGTTIPLTKVRRNIIKEKKTNLEAGGGGGGGAGATH